MPEKGSKSNEKEREGRERKERKEGIKEERDPTSWTPIGGFILPPGPP
jgi:hypothetical protein